MSKVGIITYHFAKNYGAVLQCYALQKFLEKSGNEVEILNYISKQQERNNGILKRGKAIKSVLANICLIPFYNSICKKHERYNSFCKEFLNLSRRFSDLNDLEAYVNSNDFSTIISGSDQVFNPRIEDFDKAFLYPFKTSAKKISYAASTGSATKEDIKQIEEFLADFDQISIREKSDLWKFDETLAKKIKVVCDPVILANADLWDNIIHNKHTKPYLVCYFLHKQLFKKEFMAAKRIAKILDLDVKVINARFSSFSFIKGTIFDAGPKEFVELISNASYVCTDSMHGTIFSLIFNKRFSCFDSRNNKTDSRKKELLEKTGANHAYQYVEDEIKICPELNYTKIEKKIELMRENAMHYLTI